MRLTLLAISLAILNAAPAAASDSPGDLVNKLGDKSFKVRTDAAVQLVKLGSAAVPALTEGSKHKDAEIAEQCRKLLAQAIAAEQEEKLAAFLRNPAAPPPKGLAGAEQFLKVTGDNRAAREVYANLMRNHREAMVTRETDPKAAGEMLYQYGVDLNKRVQLGLKNRQTKLATMGVSPAEITLFFVFAADPRISPKNWSFRSMVALSTELRSTLTEGEHAPVMRKLFMNWLFKEPEEAFQRAGFELATELKMPDFLPRAVQAINDRDVPAKTKAMAMISGLQIGSKEHIKILTPYLTDETEVDMSSFPAGVVLRTQVRDVAMGMSVRLAEEKEEDFGLGDGRDDRFGGLRGVPQRLAYYGFKNAKLRDEAHAKWKDWLRKNPEFVPATELAPNPRVIDEPGKK
jgi:hypothetical protein